MPFHVRQLRVELTHELRVGGEVNELFGHICCLSYISFPVATHEHCPMIKKCFTQWNSLPWPAHAVGTFYTTHCMLGEDSACPYGPALVRAACF